MKKSIIKNYYLLLLFLPIMACSDFLDQEPGSSVSVDEVFSSYEGFQEALAGAYTDMQTTLFLTGNFIYADLMGGNITFSPSSSSSSYGAISVPSEIENINSFNDDADESDLYYTYSEFYDNINAANLILEYLPDLEGVSTDSIQQIKAECLCIRALDHFILLNLYGQNYTYTDDASHLGIIYNQSTQEVGVDYPARATVAQCYEYIISDLETALENFTDNNILEGESYSYFNEISCKALLAKVALYAHNYDKAISYAGEVILNSGVQLMTEENYVSEWSKETAPVSEIIMEITLASDGDEYDDALSEEYGYTSESDYADYTASDDLLSLYDDGDVRGSDMFIEAYLDTQVSYQESTVSLPYYFTRKFQDNAALPLLRLSEMYLIRAEAYARNSDPENALTDLNTIRENRGAVKADITDDLLEEIYLERRKELCFEGNLFFDLARYHKDVERNSGCIANTCDLSYPSSYYVLPIPDYSIRLNSNLIQNEDY